jgi:hypothetical protein
MDEYDLQQRLSRISTAWSDLIKAHGADADARTLAQYQLVQRYSGAVYRYPPGATRDPDVADELFQEFALGIVRGDFKHADAGRGPLPGKFPSRPPPRRRNPIRPSWKAGVRNCWHAPGRRWSRSSGKPASRSTRSCTPGPASRTCPPHNLPSS